MRITSRDVAQAAGVSRATVSYVLNNNPNQTISAETRRAVLAAAERLGYRPDPGGRALKLGRSDAVLFPLSGVSMTYIFAGVIDACSAALNRHGLTLVTDFTHYRTAAERAYAWLRLHPAAMIDLLLRRDDPTRERLRRAGVPLVSAAIPHQPATMSAMDVISDRARHYQAAYLLARGYRNLVYAVPDAVHRVHMAPGRQQAMHQAVRDAGARLRIQDVELTRASMTAAVTGWRQSRDDHKPDAICAYNDELAIGLLSALAEQGVRVPDDLAVIGVDDLPLSSVVAPSLTTVTWTVRDLGDSLAATTKALLDGAVGNLAFEVPDTYVIARESA